MQKSVVVLANQCILGSVRSKLGLVTQAFFAQRDFSKVDLIDVRPWQFLLRDSLTNTL